MAWMVVNWSEFMTVQMGGSVLNLEIRPNTIYLNQQPLLLTQPWLELLQLAALHTLESPPDLTPLDVQQLPSWRAKSVEVIKSSLSREHKKWVRLYGVSFLTGQLGKAFRLNPELTPVLTESVAALQEKLRPKSNLLAKLENPEAEVQANLMLAKLSIENGLLEKALVAIQNALNANASPVLKQEALFYQARVYEFRSEFTVAHQSLQRLKKCLEWHEKNNSPSHPRAKAWFQIGTARIYLRQAQWQEAKSAYLAAKKYLEPHHYRELGMVFNGLGRVAQNTTHLDVAQKHYEQALEFYHRAEWTWAVQATLNDCGVVYKERCKLIWKRQNHQAQKHLEQAFRYFTLCQQNCEAAQTGDESAVLEINLGWCYRMFEQFDLARQWLEKAVQLATKARNLSDLGWAYMEYAELELVTNGKLAAAEMYSRACGAFEDGQIDSARDLAKYKLEEMLR